MLGELVDGFELVGKFESGRRVGYELLGSEEIGLELLGEVERGCREGLLLLGREELGTCDDGLQLEGLFDGRYDEGVNADGSDELGMDDVGIVLLGLFDEGFKLVGVTVEGKLVGDLLKGVVDEGIPLGFDEVGVFVVDKSNIFSSTNKRRR